MFSFIKSESGFDTLLRPYRVHADRIMVGMNAFLLLICFAIAPLRDTFLAVLLVGVPTLLLSYWLSKKHGGELATRLYMGCAFMAYTGLIIHQTGGDIEAHFSAFGLIGVLLYYRDWRTIVAATIFIYLHHLILGYAQTLGAPVYVFDDNRFWSLFGLHVAYFLPFIGMMVYLSIWLRREGFDAQYVIDLAEQIARGNLMESYQLQGREQASPLLASVVKMKSRLLDLLRVLPVPAAVIRIDNNAIVNVNEAWERIFGPLRSSENFSQCPIWADRQSWSQLLQRLHASENNLLNKIEVKLIGGNGTPLLCELSIILHNDASPVMAILSVDDITERRRAELTMHRLAYRDILTELPNRTSLQVELDRAFQDWLNMETPFALMMLDLDGFKPVNDTYGHDAGDEVLKIIGQRILQINRGSDFAARLGGDEFVAIIRNCATPDQAVQVGQRLLETISRPIKLASADTTVQIGCSGGVSHINQGASDSEALLKQADTALYAAKAAGKNQISVYASA